MSMIATVVKPMHREGYRFVPVFAELAEQIGRKINVRVHDDRAAFQVRLGGPQRHDAAQSVTAVGPEADI